MHVSGVADNRLSPVFSAEHDRNAVPLFGPFSAGFYGGVEAADVIFETTAGLA